MVKGTTRQVILVKGSGEKLFEQAIFLVREEALSQGGVTEEKLLKEAKEICANGQERRLFLRKFLWGSFGAGATGLLWLMSILLK